MRGQRRHHLPGHLQLRNVRVQVETVDALDLEGYMPIDYIS